MSRYKKPLQVNTIDSTTTIDGIKTKPVDQNWKLRLEQRQIEWINLRRYPKQSNAISSSSPEEKNTVD